MDDKYVLVSFDDSRMKGISEVLGNESCKKIINFLAERKSSETDISRELGMPLNTVGYNIKKLLSAGLIEKVNWFWSVKGKKMPVYKVSQKSIVISPKQKSKMALKMLPVIVLAGIAAFFIRLFSMAGTEISEEALNYPSAASEAVTASGDIARASIIDTIWKVPSWEWFLIGALFALLVYFLVNLKIERRD